MYIVPAACCLRQLTRLHLNDNKLQGAMPAAMSFLANVPNADINFSDNSPTFCGPIALHMPVGRWRGEGGDRAGGKEGTVWKRESS